MRGCDYIVELPQGTFYGIIYKIENIQNGKVYIGQTIKKQGFYGRYPRGNICASCKNSHLNSAIKKYGLENFKIFECIDVAYDRDDLNSKEMFWINFYHATDPRYGYNKHVGGSPEFIISKESLEHMKSLKRGHPSWNKGLKYGEETKRKIREHHADFRGGKHPQAQAIRCITTGEVFETKGEAAQKYGFSPSGLVPKALEKRNGRCGTLPDGTPLYWERISPKRKLK